MASIEVVQQTTKDVSTVVNHFTNCSIPHALLEKKRKKLKITKGLEKECKTRFGTKVRSMRSVLDAKAAIIAAVEDPSWQESAEVRAIVNGTIWGDMAYLLELLEPICDAIHLLEGDSVTTGDAYGHLRTIDMAVEAATTISNADLLAGADDEVGPHGSRPVIFEQLAARSEGLSTIWQKRREFSWHNVYLAGALLDPKHYHTVGLLQQDERVKGEQVIFNMAGGGTKGQAALTQLRFYLRTPDKLGILEHCWGESATANGVDWWRGYGANCPALQQVSITVSN